MVPKERFGFSKPPRTLGVGDDSETKATRVSREDQKRAVAHRNCWEDQVQHAKWRQTAELKAYH